MLRLAYSQKIYNSVEIALDKNADALLFFPVEEEEILNFYDKYHEKRNLYSALPPEESFHLVRDKLVLADFCRKSKIAAPEVLTFDDLDNLSKLPFPLVYKPRTGEGSYGVKFVDSKEELNLINRDDSFFIQKKIQSSKNIFGAFFLMSKGQLIAYYSHERIRTFPESGGVTVFSRSSNNLIIKDIGIRLLEKLNWSGLAMIEFLYDDLNDEYSLIEINPRAWGSFLLSEFCGASFAKKYHDLAIGHSNKDDETTNPIENVGIRWIFPWDLFLLFSRKISFKDFFFTDTSVNCYINFTYSSIFRSIAFHLFSLLSMKNLKKIVYKIKG